MKEYMEYMDSIKTRMNKIKLSSALDMVLPSSKTLRVAPSTMNKPHIEIDYI